MSSDYQLEDTVFLPFTTRAFATGIPTALLGTPAIDIYEDVTATPIITGETLNVSLNSVAGFNMITVTATAATGFGAGQSYTAIIETGTVDSVSVVGEVVAHFTLDMSAAAKDLANATDGLGAIKAETALIVTDTGTTLQAELDAIQAAVITNAAGTDVAADIIALKAETALILTDTGTTLQAELDAIQAAVITNAAGTDVAADIIALKAETALILTDTGTTLQAELDAIQAAVITNAAGDDVAADIIALKAETALIVADTNELQADWTDAGRLDALLDAIPTTAMRGTDSAALASEVTAVRMATLTDWINGGRLDLLLDAIKVVTDKFVFTNANEVDANTKSINDAEVVGDGNATPWDGA